jgi:hypothetical protein
MEDKGKIVSLFWVTLKRKKLLEEREASPHSQKENSESFQVQFPNGTSGKLEDELFPRRGEL